MTVDDISVVIPTYQREQVVLDTLAALLRGPRAEIVVVDQTPAHEPAIASALERHEREGAIRWLRLDAPSIPRAMNEGLRQATRSVVLFLDDDIVPGEGLLAGHAAGYRDDSVWAVAGQVLQPGQEVVALPPPYRVAGLRAFLDFPFNSGVPAWVENGMAGNLSVRRQRALAIGGFDENYVGAGYRFETDFSRRLCRAGGKILFQPEAQIRHLRAPHGGIRSQGSHLSSASPIHGVGDYYFALRHGSRLEAAGYILARPLRETATRYHLRRPWWVPVKLLGELRALAWAVRLAARGPRYAAPPPRGTA